ncbi:RidA family protein [candidate division WOR-3 bacterium]|nr:RidA family protein [candidate division WOR-3 bacterium]
MKKEIRTDKAPLPIGPYSQAVKCGNFIFLAGQIGINPQTGELVEGTEAQTRQVMENLKAVLAEAGATMDDVVRCDIHLVDLGEFSLVNGIYAGYFQAPYPARVTVASASLPKGARVEIAAIATI